MLQTATIPFALSLPPPSRPRGWPLCYANICPFALPLGAFTYDVCRILLLFFSSLFPCYTVPISLICIITRLPLWMLPCLPFPPFRVWSVTLSIAASLSKGAPPLPMLSSPWAVVTLWIRPLTSFKLWVRAFALVCQLFLLVNQLLVNLFGHLRLCIHFYHPHPVWKVKYGVEERLLFPRGEMEKSFSVEKWLFCSFSGNQSVRNQ